MFLRKVFNPLELGPDFFDKVLIPEGLGLNAKGCAMRSLIYLTF